jgi:hypothetical protein
MRVTTDEDGGIRQVVGTESSDLFTKGDAARTSLLCVQEATLKLQY